MLFDNEMTNLLMFVCIGLLAGLIVGELRQGEGYGLLGNAIIGFLGALLGGFLFKRFEIVDLVNIGFPPVMQTALSAVVGAGVLLFLLDRLGLKT
jgi:uncharacterized membrane protein YeaQ/YmgE (transglycosylase-associated protein family)